MPIANGNSRLEFGWDGTDYVLPYVNVTAYDSKPIYAEDGYTLIRYETTVSGTALLSDGTPGYSAFLTALKTGVGKLDYATIYVTTEGGTSTLFTQLGPDALNGPLMDISATEITGRRAAMVNFTVTSNETKFESAPPVSPLLSNRWVSSFSLDAVGTLTRTTTGSLTVDLKWQDILTDSSIATRTDIAGRRPWADLFRKAILPLYTGDGNKWRRESQTFAYNEAGNQLIYTIVDKQATHNLPDAALSGSCDFTYERTMSNMAYATLRFSCDLESSVVGSAQDLLNAAVILATSRIPLKNYKSVRIDRIMVNEQELLNKVKLRFEITVLAPAISVDAQSGTYNTVPLAAVIGRYFSVTRTCPWQPSPYGAYYGMMAYPHWKDNDLSAKKFDTATSVPVADILTIITDYCSPGTPTITMIGGDPSLASANSALLQGPFVGLQKASYGVADQPSTVEKAQTITNVTTDTRMHRLQTLYTEGSDFVFQSGKASVVLEEVTTVKRTNIPPERVFRPLPAGFMLVKDDWKVNFGDTDPSGNRSFIGVYTRTLRSYDSGGITTAGGYFTDSGRRQWWSPSQTVTSPLALGFDSTATFQDSTKTVLENVQSQAYALGTPQAYA